MIVFDGHLHDDGPLSFDLSDRGLLLADGLFETFLAVDRRLFRRAAHLDRLLAGAEALGLAVARDRLEADLDCLLGALPAGPAVVRLTVTRGPGARGLQRPAAARPTVIVTRAPWSADLVFRPQRLVTTTIRRNPTSPAARFKTLAYVDAIAAMAEAEACGADDALFLDTAGAVACSTMANVFAVFGDRLATPDLRHGALAGTTRGAILEIAADLGLATEVATLSPADLAAADALVLTNAVRLVSPVATLDGRAFEVGHPVPRRLLDALGARIAAECGRDPRA